MRYGGKKMKFDGWQEGIFVYVNNRSSLSEEKKEALKAKMRQWQADNRELVNQRAREWKKQQREKLKNAS